MGTWPFIARQGQRNTFVMASASFLRPAALMVNCIGRCSQTLPTWLAAVHRVALTSHAGVRGGQRSRNHLEHESQDGDPESGEKKAFFRVISETKSLQNCSETLKQPQPVSGPCLLFMSCNFPEGAEFRVATWMKGCVRTLSVPGFRSCVFWIVFSLAMGVEYHPAIRRYA